MLNLKHWMHKVREELYIVAVQVGAVKIYVAAATMEVLWQNERQGETQEPINS